MLIYVSSYEDKSALQTIGNAIIESGNCYVCPELMDSSLSIASRLQILARCDGIWLDSSGENNPIASSEWARACSMELPYWDGDIPDAAHPTEIACPRQTQTFMSVIMRLYRLHLDKNADYSPANILGAGQIGVMTRFWDKAARLMNLYGFRLQVTESNYETPRSPKNESIEDSWLDAAAYAIIAVLLRRGQWGK